MSFGHTFVDVDTVVFDEFVTKFETSREFNTNSGVFFGSVLVDPFADNVGPNVVDIIDTVIAGASSFPVS